MPGKRDGSGSVPMEDFLGENYRLLTVISVFAALTAYFAELTNPEAISAQYGTGGAIILFYVSSFLGAKRIWHQINKIPLSKIRYAGRLFGYSALFSGFAGIIISLTLLMLREYPQGSGKLFEFPIIVLVLIILVSSASEMWNYEGATKASIFVKYSPILGVGFVIIVYGINWVIGNPIPVSHENPNIEIAYFLIPGVIYAIFVIPIALLGYSIDRLAVKYRSSDIT